MNKHTPEIVVESGWVKASVEAAMKRHTPGPWSATAKQKRGRKYFEHGETITICGCNTSIFGIAKVEGPSNFDKQYEMRANAALISAAPDMLEALKHIYDYSAKQFEANSDERALWAQINKMAAAAIAKAEGRPSC